MQVDSFIALGIRSRSPLAHCFWASSPEASVCSKTARPKAGAAGGRPPQRAPLRKRPQTHLTRRGIPPAAAEPPDSRQAGVGHAKSAADQRRSSAGRPHPRMRPTTSRWAARAAASTRHSRTCRLKRALHCLAPSLLPSRGASPSLRKARHRGDAGIHRVRARSLAGGRAYFPWDYFSPNLNFHFLRE